MENDQLQILLAEHPDNPEGALDDKTRYSQSLKRTLWLMQISILTLGHSKYLEAYLENLKNL